MIPASDHVVHNGGCLDRKRDDYETSVYNAIVFRHRDVGRPDNSALRTTGSDRGRRAIQNGAIASISRTMRREIVTSCGLGSAETADVTSIHTSCDVQRATPGEQIVNDDTA